MRASGFADGDRRREKRAGHRAAVGFRRLRRKLPPLASRYSTRTLENSAGCTRGSRPGSASAMSLSGCTGGATTFN
jgi:hypothetical protein